MRASISSLALLLLASSALGAGAKGYPELLKEWQACAKDAECVAVPAICGSWQCVNPAHEETASKYFAERTTMANCHPTSHRKPAKVKCVKKACSCELPKP